MLRSIGGSLLATRLRAALAAGAGVAVVLAAVVAHLRHLRARRIKRSWPHGVEVRPSLIRGGGDGLFAGVDFAAGAWLGGVVTGVPAIPPEQAAAAANIFDAVALLGQNVLK